MNNTISRYSKRGIRVPRNVTAVRLMSRASAMYEV
jgi:hypothetical protein